MLCNAPHEPMRLSCNLHPRGCCSCQHHSLFHQPSIMARIEIGTTATLNQFINPLPRKLGVDNTRKTRIHRDDFLHIARLFCLCLHMLYCKKSLTEREGLSDVCFREKTALVRR